MGLIRNERQLLANASSPATRRARKLALGALEEALRAVDPYELLMDLVSLDENLLTFDDFELYPDDFRRLIIFGAGKASGSMLRALERILGEKISGGVLCVPRGISKPIRSGKVEIYEGSHPKPDGVGVRAARRVEEIAKGFCKRDLVICIFSGGGSALLPAPKPGISLREKTRVADLLMKAGATIDELNCLRKHLSTLKGGQLAKMVSPATVVSLLLSDVVGDRLDTIASGPTAPDPTTYNDAVDILKKYKLWGRAPSSAKRVLSRGAAGRLPDTPKPGDETFKRVCNIIIGNNETACAAAARYLRSRQIDVTHVTSALEGEARHVGGVLGSIARRIAQSDRPPNTRRAIVAGGETTVTVVGRGRGGRNQELALGAALRVQDLDALAVASLATDGVDGPTDAAGAIVDGATIHRARARGMSAAKYLQSNDSYRFFKKLRDLILTGPTATNVGDVSVAVIL